MIEVSDLAYQYEESGAAVIEDIGLTVADGEYLALIGPTGCGKTTLVKHLNALLTPLRGRVSVDGLDTRNPQDHAEIRRKVGLIFQNPDNQIVGMTVEEDIAFGPGNLGLSSREIKRRVEEALAAVGIEKLASRAPHTLSGGEKRLLTVAGVLAMHPRYIILDEPTSHLDPSARKRILTLLRRLHEKGIGIVHVTHSMDEIVGADRLCVMGAGRIVMNGRIADVFAQEEDLNDLGLEVPQITRLMRRLHWSQPEVNTGVFAIEEAVGEIRRLLAPNGTGAGMMIQEMAEKAAGPEPLTAEEALNLYRAGCLEPFPLMAAAAQVRERFKGKNITLCSIINAKSGRCRENCTFCAQSAHYRTDAQVYELTTSAEMIRAARAARETGAEMFGIVTSGTSISRRSEWDEILRAVEGMRGIGIRPCASLGLLDARQARELKEAGLFRYHHNLETSRTYFPKICTTHDYESRVETVLAAREAGLSTCSGGIIGLGESIQDRIELAILLRDLGVDSVPFNVLNPIPGTPLEKIPPLSPMEILVTIALFRFILPSKDVRMCGGKEKNLRQLLPMAVVAGANAFMTGNYLTTPGRSAKEDLEMIRDLGFTVAGSRD